MDKEKLSRLEAKGWKIGSVAEFLELTPEEAALIEIRLVLSQSLRRWREPLMTQAELAKKIGSSQPRIARAEAGDSSVSLDLIMRAMLATGATPEQIGEVIASTRQLVEA